MLSRELCTQKSAPGRHGLQIGTAREKAGSQYWSSGTHSPGRIGQTRDAGAQMRAKDSAAKQQWEGKWAESDDWRGHEGESCSGKLGTIGDQGAFVGGGDGWRCFLRQLHLGWLVQGFEKPSRERALTKKDTPKTPPRPTLPACRALGLVRGRAGRAGRPRRPRRAPAEALRQQPSAPRFERLRHAPRPNLNAHGRDALLLSCAKPSKPGKPGKPDKPDQTPESAPDDTAVLLPYHPITFCRRCLDGRTVLCSPLRHGTLTVRLPDSSSARAQRFSSFPTNSTPCRWANERASAPPSSTLYMKMNKLCRYMGMLREVYHDTGLALTPRCFFRSL